MKRSKPSHSVKQLQEDGVYKDGFVGLLESRQEEEALLSPVYKLKDVSGEVMHMQVRVCEIVLDGVRPALRR